ncbi:DNA integrity scanning protein DisA [Rubrobacter taiwanensis]|jgi:diadenylate cyclase|uniref:DNA integrity scanning protein DisA n=1 Tax=Rubrobacter taiwanensis TaxID=185139 RepID=A0A4R1BG93_9ACTN|nr:DNA integrity scanning diadenylate cyclase DisA [Rubrobacter taiwanensis]TCJ16235.1 DNA integrity scanning protein DisA [Rubrobacter taiwanensis]
MSPGRLPDAVIEVLPLVAPGTALRDALDNIIRGRTGGLIVFADPEKLEKAGIISGGIKVECAFTPMRLYELAKMDGAIIVSRDITSIHYANVHLRPKSLPSGETGMRHLAAHRTAQQTGALVIAVSDRRNVVTIYLGKNPPYVLEDIGVVLAKVDSALATLEKFTRRLRGEARVLDLHEYDGAVTLREVVQAIRTFEYTARIADEIETYVIALGKEGRLANMQLEQAFRHVPDQYDALLRDYVAEGVDYREARRALRGLSPEQLSESSEITQILGYGPVEQTDEFILKPRGYRQLIRVPRLPERVAERIVHQFGSLGRLMEADEEELDDVEGVGQARARAIRRGLARQKNLEISEELF